MSSSLRNRAAWLHRSGNVPTPTGIGKRRYKEVEEITRGKN
jgi:hypothetical protein